MGQLAIRTGKDVIKVSVGLIVSLASILFVLRDVDLPAVGTVLREVDHRLALLGLLTVILTTIAKAMRWRLLLGKSHEIPATRALSFTIINHTINNVFPLRLGEMARVYLASEKGDIPVAVSLGSIVLEKALDTAILLASLAIVLPLLVTQGWILQTAIVSSGVLVLLLSAVIIARREKWILRFWLARTRPLLPQRAADFIDHQVAASLDATREIANWHCLVTLIGWSATIWILSVATNHLTLLALGIDLPMTASIFLLAILQIGVALPSAPGRLGLFQATVVFGLSFYSLNAISALAYSLILYVVVFIPVSTAGVFLLFREQASLPVRSAPQGWLPELARLADTARGGPSRRKR